MVVFNFNAVNQFGYGSILVDIVPENPVNDNYF